jgi:hypothetical protein
MSLVFQNIDLPPPSPPGECVSPAFVTGGRTHSPGGEGVGGQYFGRRETKDWPLTVIISLRFFLYYSHDLLVYAGHQPFSLSMIN